MNPILRNALRHYLHVLALCCVVAVLTTLMWPNRSYLSQLAYSICIGTLCWGTMEFGRYAVPPAHCHGDAEGGHGWPRGWRGLVLTVAGILVGFYAGDWLAYKLVGPANPSRTADARDSMIGLYITVAAGAIGSFYFHTRGKAAALAAAIAAAERDATEAKLKLLETQLEPHMLFNTLANLRVLITLDPPRAVAMLDRLNSYLRATLGGSRATLHPLAQEFDRLADYLELMAVRMGPRLRYQLELPDALRAVPVPPLLLQPLVENAIRHGLEPQVEGGAITVRAWQEDGADGARLVLQVQDTGVGLPADGAPATGPGGFGVTQVRERLQALHGERASVALQGAPGGGTEALLRMPLQGGAGLRTMAAPAPAPQVPSS
ncbi:sensor histidine kinase [Pseudorhodoferax sp. Leaf265]|uniref:sensor histidine kinase n=1 Tax=Pseudorhodoferax sp. Leaf265 TaxID=1736315 RepID=UPI0007C84F9B|nr:histidine kinase [Pseudorhodoferax sp. Leaf265]